MNVNFNKMLEMLIFQRSYAQYSVISNTHPITINRLRKAGAALVITISSYIASTGDTIAAIAIGLEPTQQLYSDDLLEL